MMPLVIVLALIASLMPTGVGRTRLQERVPSTGVPFWLVPGAVDVRPNALAAALTQLDEGHADVALAALRNIRTDAIVAPYVRLHRGQAELAAGDADAAMVSAAAVLKGQPVGYLREAAFWLAADAAEARSDWAEAVRALLVLKDEPLPTDDLSRANYRLGVAAQLSGRSDMAIAAFTRVHDLFPTSDRAADAAAALLTIMPAFRPVTSDRLPVALARAQELYDARLFREARKAYQDLQPVVGAADADVVMLRLAQCDAQLKQSVAALQALQAYSVGGARPDEAEYARLGVLRDLGRTGEYIRGVRAFVDRAPDPALAHAALNDLGTYYILANDDEKAAEVFTENYGRFPSGAFAGRAAWKAGWWAFATENYAETIRLFESAAVGLRRSDYRSGWMYWAARAHERLGHREMAVAGYARTVADYRNSYYGREAERILNAFLAASRPAGAGPVVTVSREPGTAFEPGAPPSNAALVQALLAAQLFGDAAGELRRVQRLEGNSPMIEATLAYALNRKGELRSGINAMKRAYPQYMANGGDALPRDLKTVLFPVAYWDLIQKHSVAQGLDPFLIAALVAQESTFDPGIRSSANAWGLMQILPSTGQRYARMLKIRPFSTPSLTRPEINVRIGTTYFADLVKQFGGIAPALASYNAGENRVARWVAERPGVDRDEFIDSIPFPETQGYVKKIIGTAEDYRLLYRTAVGR